MRRALLLAIAVLYAVSVPWYRDAGAEAEMWLGLPDWVAVAVLCYAAVAVLNSWAWLLTDIPEAQPEPAPSESPPSESPGSESPGSESPGAGAPPR